MVLGIAGHRELAIPDWRKYLGQFAIRCLEHYRPTKVVTGMDLGWGLEVATACCWTSTPYVAAIPYRGQDQGWTPGMRAVYRRLLMAADEVVVVSGDSCSPETMDAHNQYIVAHSDRLLTLWDGRTHGGTYACMQVAQGRIPISNVYDSFLLGIQRKQATSKRVEAASAARDGGNSNQP